MKKLSSKGSDLLGNQHSGGQLELIYAVRRGREGRGIATEAVKAISSELVGTGADVVAYINPVNGASRRVLQKSGFAQEVAVETGHGERWILVGQRVAPENAPASPQR